MFNIRRSKGNIITKSVTPSLTTGRQLAASILQNIKLKAELESSDVLVQSPVEGTVPSLPVVQTRKAGSNLPTPKVDLQKHLEQNRIEGRIANMTALDAKAKESQVGYNANSRFVIRDPRKPLLPTGAPNARVQTLIGEQNAERMSAGLQPFMDYDSWSDSGEGDSILPNPDVKWVKYVEPVLASATIPVYISKGDYFLMWEVDRCYFLAGQMKMPSILRRSASENVSGLTADNSHVLISVSNATKYRNMTKSEFDSIVSSQPPIADLFRVYIQFCNQDKILMDCSKATTIWSTE